MSHDNHSHPDKTKPVTMLVTYVPKKGHEAELKTLIEKHVPVLAKTGLVTDEPARVWRATDKRSGEVYFVELFSWKDGEASSIAHQSPEVMAVWEPMGPILQDLKLAQIEPI